MKSISLQPSASDSTPRAESTSRAVVISRQLKEISERIYKSFEIDTAPAVNSARNPTIALDNLELQRVLSQQPVRRSWLKGFLIAFVLSVLVPSIASGIYLSFIASNQYATEIRFAVRGGPSSVLESVGSNLLAVATAQQAQDSMVLADYVDGREIVQDLQKTVNLRKMFSRPSIDYLWRFNPSEPTEELVKYWRKRTDVEIDPMSGIITVVVRAFTPHDSLTIANGIIASSEKLVNRLTDQSRRDALQQAKEELQRTEANLQAKVDQMRQVRDSGRVIDATKMADSLTTLVGQLRLDLLQQEQQYAVQRKSMDPSAPPMQVAQARIDSTRQQIKDLESELTTTKATTSTPALSASMNAFDKAMLDRTIAEQQYAAAAAAYDRARVELETQQVYLATFVKPVLPQEPLYPKRFLLWSIISAGALLLWGCGIGAATLIRNYRGI